ncbi:MAG: hypothetical protein IH626_09640 [Rhodospirillales bacterium]|nr:hypothetical protein [Rhodospirillales bacterium]
MTDGMDRDELIKLLEQLGDESDQTVLSAARAIHTKVAASGQTWDDLLAGPTTAVDVPELPDERDDTVDDAQPIAAGPLPDNDESLRLIARLLDSANTSEELRAELSAYKADIEAGEFADDDRRYLRALYRRLKKE